MFKFVLQQNSAFRIYVPPHPAIDVDFTLVNASGTIAQRVLFGEEIVLMNLYPGSYTVNVRDYRIIF